MITTTLFVKPVPGRAVRNPDTGKPLPAAGAAVFNNHFWRRRVRDGDVVAGEAPDAPVPAGAAPGAVSTRYIPTATGVTS